MYLGIDVSSNNPHVNWKLVARSGITHAVLKVSEGLYFDDGYYAYNVSSALDAGLSVGAYHYGRPSTSTGAEEADTFLELVKASPSPHRLILDLEDERVNPVADLGAYALDFLQTVEAEMLRPPFLYTNRYYARSHKIGLEARLAAFPLWLAAWSAAEPISFSPWPDWEGWQFTDSGACPGVVGPVDQSVWRNDWR